MARRAERACSQRLKPVTIIIIILLVKYLSTATSTPGRASLPGAIESALLDLAGAAISMAVGVYTKSILSGALSFLFLVPRREGLLAYEWYALAGLTLLGLAGYSYIRGAHDSALEVLAFPSKPKLTPILASITAGYILWTVNVEFTREPMYWAYLLLGGVLLSKTAPTLPEALAGSLTASLGSLGALAVSLYASYAPLPPLECPGATVGRLVGYEAETSTTRSVAGGGRRWRTATIACSRGRGVVRIGDKPIVWVYSRTPLGLARRIAEALALNNSRIIILDLDSPGEEDTGRITELLGSKSPIVEARLGSLGEPVMEGVLAVLPELVQEGDLVVLASCRHDPESLTKYIGELSRRAVVVAGFCRISGNKLSPLEGEDGSAIVLGDLGDPLEASTVLSRLFGENWRRLYRIIRGEARYALIHQYCNGGWALVELSI